MNPTASVARVFVKSAGVPGRPRVGAGVGPQDNRLPKLHTSEVPWSESLASADGKPTGGTTAWLVAPEESKQFAPSKASFMVNYRVDDLHAMVAALKAEGCDVLDKIEDSEYGKFGWVIDPGGNKVELWQPPAGQ